MNQKTSNLQETCIKFYSEYSFILNPVGKFLVAFLAFRILNSSLGYVSALDNMLLILILAVISAVLPTPVMVFLGGLQFILQAFRVHMAAAAVVFLLILILYIFFLRFDPKSGLILVLTPLACHFGLGAMVAIAAGLLLGPVTLISIACGTLVYGMVDMVAANAQTLQEYSISQALGAVTLLLKYLTANTYMVILVIALVTAMLTVYFLHRLSVNGAWHIAVFGGTIAYVLICEAGSLLLDVNLSVLSLLISAVAAVVLGEILILLFWQVDYEAVEYLQFEDDDYVYYVKAVPKLLKTPDTEPSSGRSRGDYAEKEEEDQEEEIQVKASPKKSVDEMTQEELMAELERESSFAKNEKEPELIPQDPEEEPEQDREDMVFDKIDISGFMNTSEEEAQENADEEAPSGEEEVLQEEQPPETDTTEVKEAQK